MEFTEDSQQVRRKMPASFIIFYISTIVAFILAIILLLMTGIRPNVHGVMFDRLLNSTTQFLIAQLQNRGNIL